MTSVTHDSISLRGAGVVNLAQPKTGFRFTQDSLLLADFCRIRPRDLILEPGAGTGIISLLLAKKFPKAKIVADEVDPRAYGLLCRNIEGNGLCGNIDPALQDLARLAGSFGQNAFDVIVANPPYTKTGTGRKSPSTLRQSARHDQTAPLSSWLGLATLLKNKGRYFLVFPASRAAELLSLLREKNLEPKRIRFVHPRVQKPASLVLIEAVKSAAVGLEILPPLIVHDTVNGPSEELRCIYDLQ